MKYDIFIKFSSLIFLVASSVMFFSPKQWGHSLYNPDYLGVIFLVSTFLIYLPQLAFRSWPQERKNQLKKIQAALALALLLNAAGELGAYKLHLVGFEYDKFIHLINSMFLTIALGRVLSVWKNFSFRQIAWHAASVIFVLGIGWELWELLSDYLFYTLESGVYGQNIWRDTLGDVIWNLAGIMLGVFFLKNLSWLEKCFRKDENNLALS